MTLLIYSPHYAEVRIFLAMSLTAHHIIRQHIVTLGSEFILMVLGGTWM